MKVVASVAPPGLIEWRRRMDVDRHDESYDKLPFYAQLGVPEVWIIDRDTKQPEVYRLNGRSGNYDKRPLDADGWLASDAIGIELRAADKAKLAVRVAGDETSCCRLPEG